jgi:hypothetical protein
MNVLPRTSNTEEREAFNFHVSENFLIKFAAKLLAYISPATLFYIKRYPG